jgi:HPr kinase/phosphorylase
MLTNLELANHFGFNVISGDLNALQRPVRIAQLDRPGVELLGIFHFHDKDRIMMIGNKEIALINDSDPDFIYHNCLRLFGPECPCCIITQGNQCPDPVLRAAKETNAPLFSSNQDTSTLSSDMYVYLSEALAPRTALHAVLMEIYGIGVLILGESGIGKSEISLDLIRKGHRLIADDRVDISDVRGHLIGTCPESISGMMEVRGIGIINVERMFGVNALAHKSRIRLVINLVPFKKEEPLERIGMKTDQFEILGETVPLIKLPVSAARSMSEIVETAVTNFKLKDFGYDTGYEFQKRLSELHQRARRKEQLNGSALNALATMNNQNPTDKLSSEPYPKSESDIITPKKDL